MRLVSIFVLIYTATQKHAIQKNPEPTLSVRERVALLKHEIAKEIKMKQIASEKQQPINNKDPLSGSYEYVQSDNEPITPIMDFDDRKKDDKFKLRQLLTTQDPDLTTTKKVKHKHIKKKPKPTTLKMSTIESNSDSSVEKNKPIADDSSEEDKEVQRDIVKTMAKLAAKKHAGRSKSSKSKKSKDKNKSEDTNSSKDETSSEDTTFYRRVFPLNSTETMNKAFVHCQDLITPFLSGHKTNMSSIKKKLTYNDYVVMRLVQLIDEDTTGLSKDEVYSTMYQISNLQIRLFQWDMSAMKLLFNVMNRESLKKHTFRSIKHGLKRTFASWHLDITNVTNLLKQAKIFRPPCVEFPHAREGSTKSSKAIQYTTPERPRCSEESDNEDCIQ